MVLDITVHDMDTVRFVTGLEPRTVTAIGAAQGGGNVIDAVMVAGRLDEDVLLQTHDAFTVEHAGTGFELHGTDGSLVAADAMTQDPDGSITLHRAGTAVQIEIPDRDDLYVRGLDAFAAAVRGAGAPAATGERRRAVPRRRARGRRVPADRPHRHGVHRRPALHRDRAGPARSLRARRAGRTGCTTPTARSGLTRPDARRVLSQHARTKEFSRCAERPGS